jgi:sirohydrochlorin cobaltochelatase
MCHRDDRARRDLEVQRSPYAAIELARYDDAGAYRPLKTAPNLRHGWQLVCADREQALLAMDCFYPGRAAAYRTWRAGRLRTTALRETLSRQTGMYRVAGKISDERADEVVASVCRSNGGCLRTILWKRDASGAPASTLLPLTKFDPAVDQTGRAEPMLPLVCQEACNILVAALREAVKA